MPGRVHGTEAVLGEDLELAGRDGDDGHVEDRSFSHGQEDPSASGQRPRCRHEAHAAFHIERKQRLRTSSRRLDLLEARRRISDEDDRSILEPRPAAEACAGPTEILRRARGEPLLLQESRRKETDPLAVRGKEGMAALFRARQFPHLE
jgi:hypothetical protein